MHVNEFEALRSSITKEASCSRLRWTPDMAPTSDVSELLYVLAIYSLIFSSFDQDEFEMDSDAVKSQQLAAAASDR
jgi:hypothetical protein